MWLPKTQKGRAKFLLRRAKGLNTYEAERLRRHIARELRYDRPRQDTWQSNVSPASTTAITPPAAYFYGVAGAMA